jgi:hypothetical protein
MVLQICMLALGDTTYESISQIVDAVLVPGDLSTRIYTLSCLLTTRMGGVNKTRTIAVDITSKNK